MPKHSLAQMQKAAEEAPYLSMGTKPPRRPRLLEPVMSDEFQRGKEAGPVPRPMPRRDEMVPTPDEERRMRRQVEDERLQRQMDEAYERAAPESMKAKGGKIGYAKGGSASSRADGCAQRGKTKGRFV